MELERTVIAILSGIAIFLAGVFLKDKVSKRAEIRETVVEAEQAEQEGAHNARQRYDERVEQVHEDAAREVDSRPTTGNARADLADRLRRHSDLIRRRSSRRR